MLKSKIKSKVVKRKIKKIKAIPKYPKLHHDKHIRNFPQTTGLIQTSLPPRPLYTSGGGIPYVSSLESYGITNKPPYYLESLMGKTSQNNYLKPEQSVTSTVLTGANPMSGNESKKNTFSEQGQTTSVEYVNLVSPAKSGNNETQPEYITLEPEMKTMKKKLMDRVEYRKKNDIPAEQTVSGMMNKPKPKTNLRGKKKKQNEEL